MCTAHLCGYPKDEELRKISKYMKFRTEIFRFCPFYSYFYPVKPEVNPIEYEEENMYDID